MAFMNENLKKTERKKTTGTSWGKVAGWYDELLEEGLGTYQSELILPNLMRLLALRKGERMLDVACGQGFFAREFAKAGAAVTGVDVAGALLNLARERSPREIKFVAAPAEKLPFASASFDAAACVLAIQNIKNAAGAFGECARVLVPGGRFVIVMNHPAFRIPKRSAWGFDEEKKIQYRRIDEYISESSAAIAVHPGVKNSTSTISFHRPLQFYFKAFGKAGFAVTRLEEWVSDKKSLPGPRATAENKARREFPLFLAMVAKKI